MFNSRRGNSRNFSTVGDTFVRRSFTRDDSDDNVWNRLDAEEHQEPDLRFKLLIRNNEIDESPIQQKPKLSERFAELSTGPENKFFDPRDLQVKYLVNNQSDDFDTSNSGYSKVPPWKYASNDITDSQNVDLIESYYGNQPSDYIKPLVGYGGNSRTRNGRPMLVSCIDLSKRPQMPSRSHSSSYSSNIMPPSSTYLYSQPEVVIPRLSKNPLPPRLIPGNRANQTPIRVDSARQALIETRMHRQNANALPSRTILNRNVHNVQTRPNIAGAQRTNAVNQQNAGKKRSPITTLHQQNVVQKRSPITTINQLNAGQKRILATQKGTVQKPVSGRIMISTKKVDGQQTTTNRTMVPTKRVVPQQNMPTKRPAIQLSGTAVPAKRLAVQANISSKPRIGISQPVVGEKRMIPTTRTITTKEQNKINLNTQQPFISSKKSFRAILLITGALPLYKKDATVIRGVLQKKMAETKTHDGDPLQILSASLVLGRLIVECANVGTFNWILNWTMVHRGDEKVVAVNPILAGDPLKIGVQVTKQMREEGVNAIIREINRSNSGLFAEHWRSISEITNEEGVLIQFSVQPIIVERIRRVDWNLKFRDHTIKVIDYRTKVQKAFYMKARI